MRPATANLQNLLAGWEPTDAIIMADLYTFTLQGGEVLRFSGTQYPVSAPAPNTDSPLFDYPLGPLFDRGKCTIKVGVEVDELELKIFADANEEIVIGASITWQRAAWAGLFDGAYLELQRAFIVSPGSTGQASEIGIGVIGTVTWFYGRVGDIDIGRTSINMKIRSELDRLTIQMPRRLFQAGCTFVFGDAMCLFDRETFSADITAQAGTDQNQIFTTLAPSPGTLYDNGTIISTSGDNTGFSRSISRLTGGVVHFLKPWVFPIGPGTTFHLLPGCDHTVDTCNNVFNNLIHFGGMPFIPPPETAV